MLFAHDPIQIQRLWAMGRSTPDQKFPCPISPTYNLFHQNRQLNLLSQKRIVSLRKQSKLSSLWELRCSDIRRSQKFWGVDRSQLSLSLSLSLSFSLTHKQSPPSLFSLILTLSLRRSPHIALNQGCATVVFLSLTRLPGTNPMKSIQRCFKIDHHNRTKLGLGQTTANLD